MQVDTSETGVRAVLSQGFCNKSTLHTVAFFSKSPAECNFDIDNTELLAVKMVLEVWPNGLEGDARQISPDSQEAKFPLSTLGHPFYSVFLP